MKLGPRWQIIFMLFEFQVIKMIKSQWALKLKGQVGKGDDGRNLEEQTHID